MEINSISGRIVSLRQIAGATSKQTENVNLCSSNRIMCFTLWLVTSTRFYISNPLFNYILYKETIRSWLSVNVESNSQKTPHH